jgi:hypothetical protein
VRHERAGRASRSRWLSLDRATRVARRSAPAPTTTIGTFDGVAQLVVNGALLRCAMGVAPGSLMVLPSSRVGASGQPVANILDSKPFVNIGSFSMCMSLGNPAVVAATAAAFGVLTPMPCTPMTAAPWMPGSPTVLSGPAPALTSTCTCVCSFGGVIQVAFPGQVTSMAP